MSTSARIIGVIDCNNFFVSCERLFRPDLKHRPVVVLSSNDGCVVARSQEIKDIGIPMGVPYFHIKDTLTKHGAAVFSSNFPLYRDISRRVFKVVRALVGSQFEQYSIDEGFFMAYETEAVILAERLRAEVLQQVGVPVSVGLASSKTLAKFANGYAKRTHGVHLLTQEMWQEWSTNVRLGEVWGVGGRRSRAFAEQGLVTVADLLAADRTRVAQLFGVEGVRLRTELSGQSVYPVGARSAPQKSIMSSRSFKESTHVLGVVDDAVAYHVRRAVEDLRDLGMKAASMTVLIRSSRYESNGPGSGVREIELTAPSNDFFTFLQHAKAAVEYLYDPAVAYKKAGVVLSNFTPTAYEQPGLFQSGEVSSRESLLRSITAINNRFGQDTVRAGCYQKQQVWRTRQEALSPAYTTRWNELRVVQA